MRSHPHVTLSPPTPLCGGCPLNDTIFETLNGRHARETRAPHSTSELSSVCPRPVWCGRPARNRARESRRALKFVERILTAHRIRRFITDDGLACSALVVNRIAKIAGSR